MTAIIVPYARFLEIRQRRERVIADLTRRPAAAPDEGPRPPAPSILGADVAVADENCGTRPSTGAEQPQNCLNLDHERAGAVAVWRARTPERDPG